MAAMAAAATKQLRKIADLVDGLEARERALLGKS